MVGLGERSRELADLGAQTYALSVDSFAKSAAFAKKLGVPLTLLSDHKHQAIERYGLRQHHSSRGIVAHPAIFIINASGPIAYRSLDDKIYRADPDELIAFLQQLKTAPFHQAYGQQKKYMFRMDDDDY